MGILFLSLLVIYLGSVKTLVKEKQKFSHEELYRINREAAKAPTLEHMLITQDVIGYHIGIRTVFIPVRDIIWVKRRQSVHTHVYHSGGVFMPMGWSDQYIDILTRDGQEHHIASDVKEELIQEIYHYLVFTVKMKRPGVIVGHEDEWNRTKRKKHLTEIVARVDAAGEKDAGEVEMIYNLDRLYELCRSDIGNSRTTEVKLMAVIAVCYLLAFFLFRYAGQLIRCNHFLKQDLFCRMFQTFGAIAKKAGIYSIAVMDDDSNQYWNLVKVGERWLAVNVGAMAESTGNRELYLLVSNEQMEKKLEAKGTYGMSKYFELP